MYSAALCIPLLVSLLPTAIARRGGSGGLLPSSSTHFVAPPLVKASLAIIVIFLVITFAQLVIAIPRISRVPSGHRLPGVAIIATLIFLVLTYLLTIPLIVTSWLVDDSGFAATSDLVYINLSIAVGLFRTWVDAMVFLAVMLTLRNRYLAQARKATAQQTPRAGPPLLPFIVVSSIIFTLMWILRAAGVGVWGSAAKRIYNGTISRAEASHQIDISDRLLYTYFAVSLIAVLFLLVFAIVVRMSRRSDKITTITLVVIIPVLVVRVVAYIIITSLWVKLPGNTALHTDALDFSNDMVYGVCYAAVMGILVYFLMVPRLWEETPPFQSLSATYVAPQQPYTQGGMGQAAQFPGQWGYTGQPQQYAIYQQSPITYQPSGHPQPQTSPQPYSNQMSPSGI